jgi:hypothetical protein
MHRHAVQAPPGGHLRQPTVSVAVSMTVTRFDSWSAVAANRPVRSPPSADARGTLISAVTTFVAVSTIEMVPES